MKKEPEFKGEFECKNCGRIISLEKLQFCPNCNEPVTLKRLVGVSAGIVPMSLDTNLDFLLK